MRKPVVFVGVAALIALAAACGPQSDSTAPPKPSATLTTGSGTLLIEPGRVGPFTVGTSSKNLLDAGLAEKPPAGGCPTLQAVGKFKGIGLAFNHDTDELMGVLVKGRGARTSEGIRVGDSTGRLTATYGSKLKKTTGTYGETNYILTDGDRGMGFGAVGGKIAGIDVFATGDEPVWDGC